mgnify:CR=1 FL=1
MTSSRRDLRVLLLICSAALMHMVSCASGPRAVEEPRELPLIRGRGLVPRDVGRFAKRGSRYSLAKDDAVEDGEALEDEGQAVDAAMQWIVRELGELPKLIALAADELRFRYVGHLLYRAVQLGRDASQRRSVVARAPERERENGHVVDRPRLDERAARWRAFLHA